MKIEINVKLCGQITGSCGWLAEKIKDAKIEIKSNALFVTYKLKSGKEKTKPICGIIDASDWPAFARCDGKFWYAYTYDEDFGCGYNVYTLFDCPLTPAANEKAEEFIQACLNKFKEVWDNDK